MKAHNSIVTEDMSNPWTLADRFHLAHLMAKDGYSVDDIVERSGLLRVTAVCIVQRVRPDFQNMAGLQKNRRELTP